MYPLPRGSPHPNSKSVQALRTEGRVGVRGPSKKRRVRKKGMYVNEHAEVKYVLFSDSGASSVLAQS